MVFVSLCGRRTGRVFVAMHGRIPRSARIRVARLAPDATKEPRMFPETLTTSPIRLTQYSHGAGCGCKISPKVLDVILAGSGAQHLDPRLWVGNTSRDDAAVYALDAERGVVSTTCLLYTSPSPRDS